MAGRLDERDRELADHLALRLDRLTLQQLAIYAAGSHDRLDLTERETAR
jgi:ABC-2 type transport system ATP-binding protein